MLTETTVSKLREMRLSVMANALKDQLADPQFQNMTFEDRLGLLVDAEWNARKNNHLNKLIRQATFSDPGACLENVEYLPDRGLKQEKLLRFSTCNYIQEHHNIILLGATGSGKTYLACALGMAAARRFYAVKYIRLPDLLVEFQIARGNGTIRKLMAQYKKYALLIIDEWLLYPLKEMEARDLLEIVESRYKRNSTDSSGESRFGKYRITRLSAFIRINSVVSSPRHTPARSRSVRITSHSIIQPLFLPPKRSRCATSTRRRTATGNHSITISTSPAYSLSTTSISIGRTE